MNADRLLELYDRIADAPDAIPRLRRFVLDLAMRGKLVEQDSADESASELLKWIAAEKVRLVKAGEIRKPRDLSGGDALEAPFEIPETWRWCRLDTVGAIIGGGTPSAADPENFAEPGEGIPWLTPADLGGYRDLYIERGARDLSEQGLQSSSATMMPAGTVLFTSRAPIGYVAIAANPISTNQGFKSIVPYVADCSRFIALAMQSFAPKIDAKASGTTFKEVSGKIVAGVAFPLPPLVEQGWIVTKVDEHMALLDGLEAARYEREATRDRLTAAGLTRLTAPETTGEDFRVYARFALDALPALTARPDQIKQLRQTILNLAVRGKLVKQDPADEPASELLERIRRKRAKRIELGELRKSKGITPPKQDAEMFQVPDGWRWCVADELWDFENGDRSSNYPSRDQFVASGVPFVNAGHLVDGRVSLSEMNYITREKFESLGGGKLRPGDQIYCLRGSLGKHAIFDLDCDAAIASSLVILRPVISDYVIYHSIYLDSDLAQTLLRRFDNGSAQPNLSSANLRKYEIPLPPLAEQGRIVVKVDELMALCDQLEANLNAAAGTRRHLLDALLAQALAPDDDSARVSGRHPGSRAAPASRFICS